MKIVNRILLIITGFIICGILCIVLIQMGYNMGIESVDPEIKVVEIEVEKEEIKLPTEVEKRVVTKEEVEAKLVDIKQLNTYMGTYEVMKSVDQTRFIFDDVAIPGTTNTINIECSGVVKVGYDIDGIMVTVDNVSDTIYIMLPEPKVMDNYIILQSIKVDEKNTFLNPINFEQYETLFAEMEEKGLAQVENYDIYERAAENMRTIVSNFIDIFPDYSVEFMN